MIKEEIKQIVETQIENGISREDAIRNIAFFIDEDDPENPELWFQQKIGGG